MCCSLSVLAMVMVNFQFVTANEVVVHLTLPSMNLMISPSNVNAMHLVRVKVLPAYAI